MGFNKAERDFIELVTDIGLSSGMSKIHARIFAVLYLQEKEISLEDLSELTGYSLSSISLKIRDMERVNLVTRRKKPGTSRVFFFIPKEFHTKLIEQWIERQENNINRIMKKLPPIIKRNNSCSRKVMLSYLKEAKRMKDFIEKIKGIVK